MCTFPGAVHAVAKLATSVGVLRLQRQRDPMFPLLPAGAVVENVKMERGFGCGCIRPRLCQLQCLLEHLVQ